MPPTGKRPGSAKAEDTSAEFDKYFSQQFGVARWRSLAKSLQKETTHVALLNQFALSDTTLDGMKPSLFVGNIRCFRLPKSPVPIAGAQPELAEKTALRTHYWMDLASVYPVVLLDAQPGMTVLDAAAAPGGKSLVLAHQMFAPARRGAPPPESLQEPCEPQQHHHHRLQQQQQHQEPHQQHQHQHQDEQQQQQQYQEQPQRAGEHRVVEPEGGLQGEGTAEGNASGTANSSQAGGHHVSKLEEGLQGGGTAKGSMSDTGNSGHTGGHHVSKLEEGLQGGGTAKGSLSGTGNSGQAGGCQGPGSPTEMAAAGVPGAPADTAAPAGVSGPTEEAAAPGAAGPTGEGSAREQSLHRGEELAGSRQGHNTAKGDGLLMVNEPDATRRARLQRVLAEYLPHALVAGSAGTASGKRSNVGVVRIIGHEAEKYWSRHESERYDRVLLDAPCSNDRHVVQQSCARRGLIPARDWSLMQCRQLAALQLQLLLAGLRALAVGGRLVYSTCSLAAMENDGVVSKALERFPNVCVVMPRHPNYFPASLSNQPVSLQETFSPEATKHGVLLMPDLCGHGPIYVSVLEKRKDQVGLQGMANIDPPSSLQSVAPAATAAATAAAAAVAALKAPSGSNPEASISPLLLP